jgi:hypothetical protein
MRDDESKGGCNSSNDKDKKYSTGIRGIIILVLHSSKNINYTNTRAILYGINVRYKCMQVLTYIQVLFNATTTAKYAI